MYIAAYAGVGNKAHPGLFEPQPGKRQGRGDIGVLGVLNGSLARIPRKNDGFDRERIEKLRERLPLPQA